MAESESRALDPHSGKEEDVELLEFNIGVKFLAKHLHHPAAQIRIGEMHSGHDQGHDGDHDQ